MVVAEPCWEGRGPGDGGVGEWAEEQGCDTGTPRKLPAVLSLEQDFLTWGSWGAVAPNRCTVQCVHSPRNQIPAGSPDP